MNEEHRLECGCVFTSDKQLKSVCSVSHRAMWARGLTLDRYLLQKSLLETAKQIAAAFVESDGTLASAQEARRRATDWSYQNVATYAETAAMSVACVTEVAKQLADVSAEAADEMFHVFTCVFIGLDPAFYVPSKCHSS